MWIKQHLKGLLLGATLALITGCTQNTPTFSTNLTKLAPPTFTKAITKTAFPDYIKPYIPPIPLETPIVPLNSFVQKHGKLHVSGANLMDTYNKPYQLIGLSSHGLQWYPQFINKSCFQTLSQNFGANVIRLALYSDDYATKNSAERAVLINTVENGIYAATKLGLYVIIDWHILSDGNPNIYIKEASRFFDYFATKYQNYPNLLFEICNEPNGPAVDWNNVIKPYADKILPIIRNSSPDSIIIVGTPLWCQNILSVAKNRLNDPNVMYSFHFYANTHTLSLRDTLTTAYKEKGLPIFVSEFGTCDASGSSAINTVECTKWLKLLNSYNISWVNWSLCDKEESSALLYPGASLEGNWPDNMLTPSGTYIRSQLQERSQIIK